MLSCIRSLHGNNRNKRLKIFFIGNVNSTMVHAKANTYSLVIVILGEIYRLDQLH